MDAILSGQAPNSALSRARNPVSEAVRIAAVDLGQHADKLASTAAFVHVCTIFLRAHQELQDPRSYVLSAPDKARRCEQIVATFRSYCQAWTLRMDGKTVDSIVGGVGARGVRQWLERSAVPLAILRLDPEVRFGKRVTVTIPTLTDPSPDLAYILGACAGTFRGGDCRKGISVHHQDRAVVQQVHAALERSCGATVALGERTVHGRSYHYLVVPPPLVNYFLLESDRNQALPWKNLTDPTERAEFLRGYLTFSKAAISSSDSVLKIERGDSRLHAGLGVLFMMEGIFPSLSGPGSRPVVAIHDANDLNLLVDRCLLPVTERAKIQFPRRTLASPLQYLAIMERAVPLYRAGGVSVEEVGKQLRMAFSDVPSNSALRRWLMGANPDCMARFWRLISETRALLSGAAGIACAEVVRLRAAETNFHPWHTFRSISELVGGSWILAPLSVLPRQRIQAVIDGTEPLQQDDYMKALGMVGLSFEREIAQGWEPPTADAVRSSLRKLPDKGRFDTYRATVMEAVRRAYYSGKDPLAVAQTRLAELGTRENRMAR